MSAQPTTCEEKKEKEEVFVTFYEASVGWPDGRRSLRATQTGCVTRFEARAPGQLSVFEFELSIAGRRLWVCGDECVVAAAGIVAKGAALHIVGGLWEPGAARLATIDGVREFAAHRGNLWCALTGGRGLFVAPGSLAAALFPAPPGRAFARIYWPRKQLRLHSGPGPVTVIPMYVARDAEGRLRFKRLLFAGRGCRQTRLAAAGDGSAAEPVDD